MNDDNINIIAAVLIVFVISYLLPVQFGQPLRRTFLIAGAVGGVSYLISTIFLD